MRQVGHFPGFLRNWCIVGCPTLALTLDTLSMGLIESALKSWDLLTLPLEV
jgi:hypothetical protein